MKSMGAPPQEFFATPADASRRADALSGRWNVLVAQALGPSAHPRSDIPKGIQDAIIADRKRFREFITRPTFGLGGAFLPRGVRQGDYEKLALWYKTYLRVATTLKNALPPGEELRRGAWPVGLPTLQKPVEFFATGARNLAIGLGVAGLATLLGMALASKKEEATDDW